MADPRLPNATASAVRNPDAPIDQAVSARDEEPAFAISTPDAPAVAEPGSADALKRLLAEDAAEVGDASDAPKRGA